MGDEADDKEVFVFGSNLAGRHGKGAALDAIKYHGAVYGVGAGLRGNSYAIPTKSAGLQTLSLPWIKTFVGIFLEFARKNQNLTFNVTRIGCGLAGYTDEQIAPMFKGAPDNCKFPDEWMEYL